MSISNANLMYYYPFDTNLLNYASGTGITDSSATNVSISNTTTKLTSGSLYFPAASNSALQIPNTTFTANGITVSVWVKLNVLNPSAQVRIFDFGSGIGTYNFTLGFNNNQFGFGLRGQYATSAIGTNGSFYSVSDTNWHHYCITMGTFPQIVVYVDGVQVQNLPNGSYPTLTTLTPCYIGKRTDTLTTYLNGYLNQFIMFNRTLSYAEIYAIYSNPNSLQFITVAAPTPAVPPGSPLTIKNTSLLAYYPLDTDILDYSTGTGVSNATATNASITTDTTAMTSGSLYFSGSTTQKLTIKNLTFNGNGITVAFWMKIVKQPLVSMTIFDFNAPGGNFTVNINTYVGNPGISITSPSIGSNRSVAASFQIQDLNWHHYCITILNTGIITFYLDAQDTFYATYFTVYPALTTYTSCLVGASNTTSNNTTYGTPNMYMNQFLVYNRVITPVELFAISKFPKYVQPTSGDSSIPTYYDSYVAPNGVILNQASTINVQYNSPFLYPGTTYTLKNAALTTFGTPVVYNNCDLSFAYPRNGVTGGTITVDACGNVYVYTDNFNTLATVKVYTSSGSLSRTVSTGQPLDCMVYDPSVNVIYFGKFTGVTTLFSTLSLSTFTQTTDVSFALSLTNRLQQFAMSPSGVLYAVGGGINGFCSINTSTAVGTSVYSLAQYPGTGQSYGNSGNTGIAVDGSGNIIIARNNGSIYKFTPNLAYIQKLPVCSSWRITCDTNTGNIYTVNFNGYISNAIYQITPSNVVSIFSIVPKTLYNIYYDKYSNRLYASAIDIVYRFTTQPSNTVSYSFSSLPLGPGTNVLNLYDPSGFGIPIAISVVCFREGTLIRCLDASLTREVYMPVEHITKDTFVKTFSQGYKRVEVIGYSTLLNPNAQTEADNRLFCYKAGHQIPALFQDLYITGNHCVLVEEFPTEATKKSVEAHMGEIYKTEGFYRLPACLDQRAEPFVEPGAHKIWHFALESDDIYENFGVYANGLLVETSSIRYMTELSKMTLK